VFLTTFSSNIPRLQQAVDVAVSAGRKVAVVGSSMRTHVEVAERLGLLRIPAGRRVDAETAMDLPPSRCMILATGSQGEPNSALARIAVDDHREAFLEPGDVVIHSARTIPGNEKAVGRMTNHLLRRGAEVVLETDAPVHVSGHPSADELRLLLHLVRPRYLIPIHGEFRQLDAHARIGVDAGLDPDRVAVLDSGDVLAVGESTLEKVDRVPVGQVFLDAALDRVDFDVLRDRRKIADDGIVVAVLALDRATGRLNGEPEIASRGFAAEGDAADLLREAGAALAAALAATSEEQRSDEGLLKSTVQTALKRFLRRRTQKRPLIIPVVVEL
jgi:ribonuclease J